jgi:SAM-dependent methyltransferase
MFSRPDETDDFAFYAKDRFVEHLDAVALETVHSHIPPRVKPAKVVGVGLNAKELSQDQSLNEWLIHDLNRDPRLPFPKCSFDAVLNTVSVDYMTRPLEVFREVGRVLRPRGLFLVVFSNRMFPQKVIKLWRQSSEEERVIYAEELFGYALCFGEIRTFLSKGRTRPPEDKYASLQQPCNFNGVNVGFRRGALDMRP